MRSHFVENNVHTMPSDTEKSAEHDHDESRSLLLVRIIVHMMKRGAHCMSTLAVLLFSGVSRARAAYGFTRRSLVATMTTVTTTTTLATATEAPYWNREISAKQAFDRKAPVTKEANVICVGDVTDESNAGLYQLQEERQNGVKVLQIGSSVEDFDTAQLQEQGANVLFVSSTPKAKQIVTHLLETIPSIEWIHTRSAGLDFIASDPLSQWSTASKSHQTTNAKGSFSSTLAEYTLLACSYLYVRLTLVC
jgi:hypothetical protein